MKNKFFIFETMRNAPYKKLILVIVLLLNGVLTYAQEIFPPEPLPEDAPPPPGLPLESGLAILLFVGLAFAFYYYKNIDTKKASN
jgi:hypothetical protein